MKKHIHYFDYLRIIAAIGVIYMHIASEPLRAPITNDWHAINVLTSLAFIAVPLFFMMSGYLLMSSEKTLDGSALLKKRIPHLIIPLITYTVVSILWKLWRNGDLSFALFIDELILSLNTPAWVHLWYMYTLIAIYLISPILCGGLRALDKKGHAIVIFIICFTSLRTILQIFLPQDLANLLNIKIFTSLTFFEGHLCTFLLGYYLGNIKKKIPNYILIAIAILTLLAIIFGTTWMTNKMGRFDQSFQKQASGFEVILAACIFLIFKQTCNRECKLLKYIPLVALSLPIYLIHNIVISILYYHNVIIKISTFGDTIIFSAIVLAISYLLSKTLATIKPLCFIFTGMTYSSACKSCNWIYTFRRITTKSENNNPNTNKQNG